MVTVKALRTTLDETGFIKKGHTSQMSQRRAKLLVDKGLVEILSEDDGTEEVAPVVRGGVRIKDVTGNISATDERKVIKKDQPVKIGPEPVVGKVQTGMPKDYAGKVIETERGSAIMGNPGPEMVVLPDGGTIIIKTDDKALEPIPEKAETSKTEPAETRKAEVKETPKKKYA